MQNSRSSLSLRSETSDNAIQWLVKRICGTLGLSSEESSELSVLLYKNYIRTVACVESLLADPEQQVLHPVIANAMREAFAERRLIHEAQCDEDGIHLIANPKIFLHGAIFVHRLALSSDLRCGFVVQTVCFDVTDLQSFENLKQLISETLAIPRTHLRLIAEQPETPEVYVPGVNLPPAMRGADFDFDRWAARLCVVPDEEARKQDDARKLVTLRDAYVGPSSELFALSTDLRNKDGARLGKRIARILNIRSTKIFPQVPLPLALAQELLLFRSNSAAAGSAREPEARRLALRELRPADPELLFGEASTPCSAAKLHTSRSDAKADFALCNHASSCERKQLRHV